MTRTIFPTAAVGSVAPDGLAAVVVITLISPVSGACPCVLVPAVIVADVLNSGVVSDGLVASTTAPVPVLLVVPVPPLITGRVFFTCVCRFSCVCAIAACGIASANSANRAFFSMGRLRL